MSSWEPSPCWMGIAGVGVLVASCSTVSMIPSTSSAMLAPPPESASRRKAYNINNMQLNLKDQNLHKNWPNWLLIRALLDKFPVKNQVRNYIIIWCIDPKYHCRKYDFPVLWLFKITFFLCSSMQKWNLNVSIVSRTKGEPENGKEKKGWNIIWKKAVKHNASRYWTDKQQKKIPGLGFQEGHWVC